tara:strand:- start:1728 stop:2354 length:627 start_codon:yes stop_codon:yes gene_type:complete
MILQNKYCCFEEAIPNRVCDDILKWANYLKSQNKEKIGFVAGITKEDVERSNEAKNNLLANRNSNVIWMDSTWIFKELEPFVKKANVDAKWNFDWEFSEQLQFTKYEPGQHYGWHQDAFESDRKINGKMMNRKLSVTLSLSNPDEYEGGELEFDFLNKGRGSNIRVCKEVKTKGSLVVFPSFLWHRVTPVTRGTRYSLVMWSNGVPWR